MFNEILSIDPRDSKAKRYIKFKIPTKRKRLADEKRREQIKQTREQKHALAIQEREKKERAKNKAYRLYQQASKHYRDREYEKAYELFKQVNEVHPGYARVEEYLEKLPADIRFKKEQEAKERARMY